MSDAIEYTIRAYPTLYRGRLYRSRLEARWAAFFDFLRLRVEYEPLDLGKWSPDFLLMGEHGSVLVEVKPITDYNETVAQKMLGARAAAGSSASLLLLGVAPSFQHSPASKPVERSPVPLMRCLRPSMGWLVTGDELDGNTATICMFVQGERCVADISDHRFPRGLLTGKHTEFFLNPKNYAPDLLAGWEVREATDLLRGLWVEACNAVQWNPPP